MKEDWSDVNILKGKLTGDRPLGRTRRRAGVILEWTLNIWMSVQGIRLIGLRIGIVGEPRFHKL